MAKLKGTPKTEGSGRKKGTPNKDSLPLEAKAKELKVDPFEILLKFAAGDWKGLGYENECYFMEKPDGAVKIGYVIPPELRAKAAQEAAQYLYPKKKALELSTAPEGIQVIIKDYTKLSED